MGHKPVMCRPSGWPNCTFSPRRSRAAPAPTIGWPWPQLCRHEQTPFDGSCRLQAPRIRASRTPAFRAAGLATGSTETRKVFRYRANRVDVRFAAGAEQQRVVRQFARAGCALYHQVGAARPPRLGVPASPGGRSGAPTVIGLVALKFVARERQEADHSPHHAEHLRKVG
jgi:hypothetical protein